MLHLNRRTHTWIPLTYSWISFTRCRIFIGEFCEFMNISCRLILNGELWKGSDWIWGYWFWVSSCMQSSGLKLMTWNLSLFKLTNTKMKNQIERDQTISLQYKAWGGKKSQQEESLKIIELFVWELLMECQITMATSEWTKKVEYSYGESRPGWNTQILNEAGRIPMMTKTL